MAVPRLRVPTLRPPAARCAGPPHRSPTRSSSTTAPTRRCCARSGETLLRVLEPSHRSMSSSLHALAGSDELDLGAFLYAIRRLPDAVSARARDRHGPGGRGVRPPRHRAAGRVDAARGARPAAALVRRRPTARWRCCSRRRRTSTTSSRRSSPTRSSGTSCARGCARATGRREATRPTPPSARRCWAARRTTGCSSGDVGRGLRAAPRRRGRATAEPAHPDARRQRGRLRADDAPLVGAGARRAGRAGARRPPDVLRLLQPALDRQPRLGHGARGARTRSSAGWRRAGPDDLRDGARARSARAARGLVGELPLLLRARLLRDPPRPRCKERRRRAGARGRRHPHLLAHGAARLARRSSRSTGWTRGGWTRGWATSTPRSSRAARR